MFSSGQITFGIIFAVTFITAMIYMYRKDIAIHNQHYKGAKWVLVAFLGFIGILFVIKYLIKQ